MLKRISAVALNLHDQNAYDGVYHNQRERHTRFKHNLPYYADAYSHQSDILNTSDYRLNDEFVRKYYRRQRDMSLDYGDYNSRRDIVLAISYTQGGIRMCKDLLPDQILNFVPKNLWDYYYEDSLYYIDHHQSHATYAFLNSGFKQSDILAIDGIGAKYRCIFVDKDYNIKYL